ncbi:hypothetical protein H072_6206 [Dactylellina haptotyla CBS 200.50]|uniref:XPG-I domain-containing protein n=1 Tax=Dactylellina haptotyla (strain CBS 200.50) TaxID=1284197 RepID=S8BXE7_DACHA|nr:hypothetical protein H072_6206 [Dactylellina haptotyla CBS 200.50]
MGRIIPNLWKKLDKKGLGHVKSLAALSSTHFEEHGRPLRIALDQDSWNYGFTKTEERGIQRHQKSEFRKRVLQEASAEYSATTEFNDKLELFRREVNVFERLVAYMSLNIQLYVVFPLPLPESAVGELGDRYRDANGNISIWFKLLGCLGVTFHAALNPAAECAHMQAKGLVDAAWSNDADILAFAGPESIIFKDKMEKGVISNSNIIAYDTKSLAETGLGWEELLLFQTLKRCGYDNIDIDQSGRGNVFDVTKKDAALSYSQCRSQGDIEEWFDNHLQPYADRDKLKHQVLRDYQLLAVIGSLDDIESCQLRRKTNRRIIKEEQRWEHAESFYVTNMVDKTRVLWEYVRDTFWIKESWFMELMGGVLLSRGLRDGTLDSQVKSPSVDDSVSPLIQFAVNIEYIPSLWNLRTRLKEKPKKTLLKPFVLKSLITARNANLETLQQYTIHEDPDSVDGNDSRDRGTCVLDSKKDNLAIGSRISKAESHSADSQPVPSALQTRTNDNFQVRKEKRRKRRPKRIREMENSRSSDLELPVTKKKKCR